MGAYAKLDRESGSLQSKIVGVGLGTLVRPVLRSALHKGRLIPPARKVLNTAAARQRTAPGITISELRSDEVSGLWLDNPAAHDTGRVILYLHGGAFVVCSPQTHKGLVSALCRDSGSSALILDYPLSPEHPFPAAADVVLRAYELLLTSGYPPSRITFGGDSAGGHLVTRLLADLDERGLPMPAGVVLFSPFLDLTGRGARRGEARIGRDPFIFPSGAEWAGRVYAGVLHPADPRLDVLGKDMRRWPAFQIHVGDTECLLPDSERLARRLGRARVPVELYVWPGQVHVFAAFGHLPEAREARAMAAEHLTLVTADQAGAAATA